MATQPQRKCSGVVLLRKESMVQMTHGARRGGEGEVAVGAPTVRTWVPYTAEEPDAWDLILLL